MVTLQELFKTDPVRAIGVVTELLRDKYCVDVQRLPDDPDYDNQINAQFEKDRTGNKHQREVRAMAAHMSGVRTRQDLELELEQTQPLNQEELLEALSTHPDFEITDTYIHTYLESNHEAYGCDAEISISPKNHQLIQFPQIQDAVDNVEEHIGYQPFKRRITIAPLNDCFDVPAIFYKSDVEGGPAFITKINIGLCDKVRGGHISFGFDDACRFLCEHKPYCGYVNSDNIRNHKLPNFEHLSLKE